VAKLLPNFPRGRTEARRRGRSWPPAGPVPATVAILGWAVLGASVAADAAPAAAQEGDARGEQRATDRPPAGPETPRVLVVRASVGDAPRADELSLGVLETLRDRGWTVRRPTPPSPPAAEGTRLAAAREAYDQLQPDRARAILDRLRRRLTRSGGAGLDAEGIQAFWLQDALVGLALGDDERTDRALRRLRVAYPKLEPDPRLYPPTLRERLAAIPADGEQVLVEVETADEALVWVDGQPLPPGERRVPLVPGTHLVRAAAGGFSPKGTEVTIPRRAGTVVRLPLAPDDEARLRRPGPPGAPLPARTSAAAARLGVGLLILDVGPRAIVVDDDDDDAPEVPAGEGSVASLLDRATGRRARILVDGDAPPGAQGGRLARAMLANTARGEGDPDPLPWIVGGAAGAAAVVAVILAIVLTRPDDAPQGFRLRWEGP